MAVFVVYLSNDSWNNKTTTTSVVFNDFSVKSQYDYLHLVELVKNHCKNDNFAIVNFKNLDDEVLSYDDEDDDNLKIVDIIDGLENESKNIIIKNSDENGEVSDEVKYRLEVISQAIKGLNQLKKLSLIVLNSDLVNSDKKE